MDKYHSFRVRPRCDPMVGGNTRVYLNNIWNSSTGIFVPFRLPNSA